MTKQWLRRGSVVILALMSMIFLASCVVTSPLLNIRPSSPVIVVDAPPNRLSITNSMDRADYVYLYEYLDMMLEQPYHRHHYRYPSGINVDFDANTHQSSKFESKVHIR